MRSEWCRDMVSEYFLIVLDLIGLKFFLIIVAHLNNRIST